MITSKKKCRASDKQTCSDGVKHGGTTRHMSYSCSPNCYVDKWEVCRYSRAGMFDNHDIQLGKESIKDFQCDIDHTIKLIKCYCI